MVKIAIVIASVFGCGLAFSQHALFGLEFGKELNLPKCIYNYGSLTIPATGACVHETKYAWQPDLIQPAEIHFAIKELPHWVTSRKLTVLMADNKLERVTIDTAGVGVEADVANALVKKYGKPTIVSPEEYRNAMNAVYRVEVLFWKLQGLNVDYFPVVRAINRGIVTIETPIGKSAGELYDQALIRRFQGKTPM
jgi:hypothetical protein